MSARALGAGILFVSAILGPTSHAVASRGRPSQALRHNP